MRLTRALAASAAIVMTAVTAVGCSSDASADSPTCPNGKIAFGIEPFEDPTKLKPAYQVLADALEEKLDCPVELNVLEDYSAEVLAMQNGKLDLGQFGPLGYVFASERAGAEPLASFGLADGKLSAYTAGIWVPKDSPIQSVKDLKGKDLALGSVGSTSGDVLPRYALKQEGIEDADLKINYAGGHPEAMLALTNGAVDAAQINSQTLATAKSEGTFDEPKFRQIWKSEEIPNDPITVRGDAPDEFKKAVEDALLNLETKDVEKVGAFLDVTPPGPLIKVTKETYKPLFDLAETMNLSEEDV